jgi:hypothetical protein
VGELKFDGMYLSSPIEELPGNTLIYSSTHNAALYDAMVVCHETKKVFLLQSSRLRGSDHHHQIKLSSIKNVLSRLGLWSMESPYEAVNVYCSDASSKTERGCVISDLLEARSRERGKRGEKMQTDEEAVQDMAILKKVFRIVIARVHYFLGVPEVILPAGDTKQLSYKDLRELCREWGVEVGSEKSKITLAVALDAARTDAEYR